MLAHESSTVSYNSQIMVEFSGDLRLEAFKNAVNQAISAIPILRSHIEETFVSFNRFSKNAADFAAADVIEVRDEILTQDALDEFCQKKFNLSLSPAFAFLFAKTIEKKHILIFNVHHTLCDASGQFHLLEEIFRIMENMDIRSGAKSSEVFRYRDLWKFMGARWFLKSLWQNFRPLSKQRQYKMATLVDRPELPQRFVTSTTIHLTPLDQDAIRKTCRDLDVSITEYLSYASFKALDISLKARGDTTSPIMIYLPKSLRPFLKIRYSLQNILTTVWIVARRDEIHKEKFLSKIKHVISSHKMDKAAKFIFGSLWAASLMRPARLKKMYQDMDSNPETASSSLLISAGRVPRSYTFPQGWSDISVWARGTMLKSPGIGVIYTGIAGTETLTFEYLKDVVQEKTIQEFQKNLMQELTRTMVRQPN